VSIRRLAVTIFTVGALAAPASAMAQDPIVQGYGGRGPTVENQITPPGQVEAEVVSTPSSKKATTPTNTPAPVESAPTAAAQPQESKGSLPFTGLDARLLALAGIALAGIGFATRRLAQRID
jgi:Tfp pilus assembly protein FimV